MLPAYACNTLSENRQQTLSSHYEIRMQIWFCKSRKNLHLKLKTYANLEVRKCVISGFRSLASSSWIFQEHFYSKAVRTVFENHRKSLIQHCERSELRLQIEWTKVNSKCQKWYILKTWSLWSNSVTCHVTFNWINIGGKCQNKKKSICDILSNFQTLCLGHF